MPAFMVVFVLCVNLHISKNVKRVTACIKFITNGTVITDVMVLLLQYEVKLKLPLSKQKIIPI